MNKLFYPKLAAINIKKNSKTYLPFIITCICTISMFYIMHELSLNKGLDGVSGSGSLKIILNLGSKVIGIFSAIFLFYTNSFLIKRRKKEIGLYNVLGLEKKHISKILFFEFLYTSIFSLVVGLIAGVILDKLMFLLLLKLLKFEVAFGFTISVPSIIITLLLFTGIFISTLLSNLVQIKVLKPIELLKGSEHGEKEPKTKWIITIIGLIALGTGYGLALKIESPLAALQMFFIAVILVMVGTYALFTAGSIAVLKTLRKNKNFYYKTSNFISVSGMMYRMKQNAIGLANICILSTCVLVMISTTVSLYVGMEDVLRTRFPRNIILTASQATKEEAKKIDEILIRESKNNSIDTTGKFNYFNKYFAAINNDGKLDLINEDSLSSDVTLLQFVSIADYNRLEGENITLKDNEAVVYSNVKNFDKNNITIENKIFNIKESFNKPIEALKINMNDVINTYVVFVNDINVLDANGDGAYYVAFDVSGSDENIGILSNKLNEKFKENNLQVHVDSSAGSKESFYSLYGGLFFIGIFLGSLFLMATVLIIYYKQISEGYDDKNRFEIMQKVGMSKIEIKKTIRSQVLMVFFLPLVTAVIHVGFAFPMITKLLAVLNLRNVSLFMVATIITILVFATIYGIVFSLTARAYYKIVE
ncbi:ABC transporter permease [Clostridium intestinale]|uniref:ABC transporter permease n=1 Tax=Clostridium intestinale TaxID=36845 RepID=UPI0028EA30F1|nr:ABC transporter permease [Clostridium intestinale]